LTALWSSQEVRDALNQEMLFNWQASGISIDSRTLKAGDLYIAIRGSAHDGHRFVEEAFAKGAVAAVVENSFVLKTAFPLIGVENTLAALTQLGTYARTRSSATVIAVTGSVGKTGVKELFCHILQAFGYAYASPASYNNHWGVPLSLANMPRNTLYGIFEAGMNAPGEISPLADMIRPHIAIITTIAEAHIGTMGSREAIAREKAAIFSGKPIPGLVILNKDDPEFVLLHDNAIKNGISKIISFGKSRDANVALKNYQADITGLNGKVTACIKGHDVDYTLPRAGEHMAVNSLAGLAVGDALGLDQKKIITQMETLPVLQSRGEVHKISILTGHFWLIDDAFNANLASMQAGINTLLQMPVSLGGRRIAVLGEMLELGNLAGSHHDQLMNMVQPFDMVFAVGGETIATAFAKVSANDIFSRQGGGYFPHANDVIPILVKHLRPNDIVFVKGSKKSLVSQVVNALVNLDPSPMKVQI
jgi:UDP-N-acetylmuramoyl-tripeptide--D-alanyl-D-alanine ligase